MSAQTTPSRPLRRRSAAGEATRERLMTTAERLFAMNGVAGVTLREIQEGAGQSNASVVTYHFGSKEGLVRALLQFRYQAVNARRAELLLNAQREGVHDDPRAAVLIIVKPLVESIQAGEMFVPFLARLVGDTRTLAHYLPEDRTIDALGEMLPNWSIELPERAMLGRQVQLYSSVLNLLGEHARSRHRISEAQLSNYIDVWVGMLTAPISDATRSLMTREDARR